MVAFVSPHFGSLGWFLEDSNIGHELENFNTAFGRKSEICSDSINLHSPNSSIKVQPIKNGEFTSFNDGFYRGDDNKMINKKLNHNASERDRRKKINILYSTLRTLLPSEDHSKKLSIPNTVSKVLDYIPELQQEVEKLIKKKETLISSKISNEDQKEHSPFSTIKNKRIKSSPSSLMSPIVSAAPISDREVVFQISMSKAEKRASLSEAVMRLEQEGFVTMSATCFESFGGRVFYNLHLQAQESQVPMDAEMLKKKVWPC